MILKRFYDDKLAQASYLFGCAATGEALVIDANRDVQQYIDAAEAEGLKITSVTETHIHADYVSGSRELASRTGAKLYLSAEGGADWQYAFASESDAVLLHDGESFSVGNIVIESVHTPGHTPEHLSFLVTDTATADEPMGLVTGDFVFVGDVGRPDLLEKAAGVKDTMREGARVLFKSLERVKSLPDYVQILPGHGAGSACGKSLGGVPQSTVGYERRYNWAFQIDDEDSFVEAVLAGQPEPPRYFAEMKRINKVGPPLLGESKQPPRLSFSEFFEGVDKGALVVDTRPAEIYARGFIPGTINIPLNRSFTTWAGWLVPYDKAFYVLVEDEGVIGELQHDLQSIGLDQLAGYVTSGVIGDAGRRLGRIESMDPVELERRLREDEDVYVLDVRGINEWEEGHIDGAGHIPLGYVDERLDELPSDKTIVVHCQTGPRAAIGTSLLKARGFDDVKVLEGGYQAFRQKVK